jgi:hypothetical protein
MRSADTPYSAASSCSVALSPRRSQRALRRSAAALVEAGERLLEALSCRRA